MSDDERGREREREKEKSGKSFVDRKAYSSNNKKNLINNKAHALTKKNLNRRIWRLESDDVSHIYLIDALSCFYIIRNETDSFICFFASMDVKIKRRSFIDYGRMLRKRKRERE